MNKAIYLFFIFSMFIIGCSKKRQVKIYVWEEGTKHFIKEAIIVDEKTGANAYLQGDSIFKLSTSNGHKLKVYANGYNSVYVNISNGEYYTFFLRKL